MAVSIAPLTQLLLLLQVLALAHVGQADAIGRSGPARHGLSSPDWSHDAPAPALRKGSSDEDRYKTGVRFDLFSRENPDVAEVVDIYSGKVKSLENFDPSRPTKVVTHGWLAYDTGVMAIKKAFLTAMDVNVIAVNWTNVDTYFYPAAARDHVPKIGQRVAYLLDFLHDVYAVPMADVHLVGHSLGAHISGMAGTKVRRGVVARITGLDPAGPLFPRDHTKRLDKSDAEFVDVIHTCVNVLGYKDAIGHVDFYPNGGTCIQPGCILADLTQGTCSHDRAYDYLEESIYNRDSFRAFPCKGASSHADYTAPSVAMGLDAPTDATGSYCLKTAKKSPFALPPEDQKTKSITPDRVPGDVEVHTILSNYLSRAAVVHSEEELL